MTSNLLSLMKQVTGLGVNRYQPGESFEVGGKKFVKFDDKAGPLAGKVASKRFFDALLDSLQTPLDNIYNALGTPYKTFFISEVQHNML